jgi:hypothetical protein
VKVSISDKGRRGGGDYAEIRDKQVKTRRGIPTRIWPEIEQEQDTN